MNGKKIIVFILIQEEYLKDFTKSNEALQLLN